MKRGLDRLMKNLKKDFLASVFKQDIKKQANFVEWVGWVGLVIFAIFVCILWTVNIDITVPAQNVKFVNLPLKDNFVIEAEVSDDYALFIKKGQKVNVKILSTLGERINIISTILDVAPQPNSMNLAIRTDLVLSPFSAQAFSEKIKNMTMRIVVDRKNIINFLIKK